MTDHGALLGPIGSLPDHALAYAEAGLEVFPCDQKTKAPLTTRGMKDASCDAERVHTWWRGWADASIGHRLPAETIVLDIDPRHGGADTWSALRSEFGFETATRVHYSGRNDGGGHIWFVRPGGELSVRGLDEWAREHGVGENNGTRHVSGIDLLRREHRYTLLPPSLHSVTGKPYRWKTGGLEVPVLAMPWPLAALIVVGETSDARSEAASKAEDGKHEVGAGVAGDDSADFDWFDAQHTWSDLLRPHGWRLRSGDGETDGSAWLHPHATSDASATIKHGCLFVWSPNTPFIDSATSDPHGYTKFRAWATLAHGGDLSAAGRALRELRYGIRSVTMLPEAFVSAGDDLSDLKSNGEHDERAPVRSRLVRGGSFVLDAPDAVPALWGEAEQVLWAQGEPFYIVGPPGVGKTTLMGQVVWGRLGLLDDVLGFPVVTGRRVLYLASDRPRQIARSFRRLATEGQRATLDDRLIVWTGPPSADVAKNPTLLLQLAHAADADTIILDSLKDMAVGISNDDVGAGLNAAVQLCIAEDIEIGGLHHQRKDGVNGSRPRTLADVYGSTWITAGAGSVLLLWASEAGAESVEGLHLKQPAERVNLDHIEHDHARGTSRLVDEYDARAAMERRGHLTVAEMARSKTGVTPDAASLKWAERKLKDMERAGLVEHVERSRDASGKWLDAAYRWCGVAVDELVPSQRHANDMPNDTK